MYNEYPDYENLDTMVYLALMRRDTALARLDLFERTGFLPEDTVMDDLPAMCTDLDELGNV